MFSQSIHSSFNCFFLSPICVSNFLENDVGVRKFGGLLRRFVIKNAFVENFECFAYSLLKPTFECTDSTR
jgi:hypothetical protein